MMEPIRWKKSLIFLISNYNLNMDNYLFNFEEEEEDILDTLEDLFEYLDLDNPTKDQMEKLYEVFLNDIVENPINIDEIIVGFDDRKSKHHLFKNKPVGFEHVCTRESKISGRRNFDPDRANKIHWIKKILENRSNSKVKYFERIHTNGKNQRYYWFKEKSFVIIIREITKDLMLVTAFCIDSIEEDRYKRFYDDYNS